MYTALNKNGAKRACTVLFGEKLISEWFDSKNLVARNRLSPLRWLRLEGRNTHSFEMELPLETWELTERLMIELSGMASPQDIALVMVVAEEPAGSIPNRVIVPWGIQDPGNLGSILRSAVAFGFQEAIIGPGCADPFSAKALRGSMGAAFFLPLRRFSADHYKDGNWIALDRGAKAIPIEDVDISEPLRLMVGNEGHGWRDVNFPPNVIRATIQTSCVESLNAAVAVGIACYEVSKGSRGQT